MHRMTTESFSEQAKQARIQRRELTRESVDMQKTEMREASLALWREMRPFVEKRTPGPMAVYVR